MADSVKITLDLIPILNKMSDLYSYFDTLEKTTDVNAQIANAINRDCLRVNSKMTKNSNFIALINGILETNLKTVNMSEHMKVVETINFIKKSIEDGLIQELLNDFTEIQQKSLELELNNLHEDIKLLKKRKRDDDINDINNHDKKK